MTAEWLCISVLPVWRVVNLDWLAGDAVVLGSARRGRDTHNGEPGGDRGCPIFRAQAVVKWTGSDTWSWSRVDREQIRGSLTHINVIPRPRDLLRIPSRGGVGIPHIVPLPASEQRNTDCLGCRPRIAYRQLWVRTRAEDAANLIEA